MSDWHDILQDITHAKPGDGVDLGLRQACSCGSGLRFKHCCYTKSRVGWCWLALSQEKFNPIAIIEPRLAECPVIMAHASCEAATSYIKSSGMEQRITEAIWLIRLPVARVQEILTIALPKEHLLIVLPEECCPPNQEPVIELNPSAIVPAFGIGPEPVAPRSPTQVPCPVGPG